MPTTTTGARGSGTAGDVEVPAGTVAGEIRSGGRDRTYVLHVPPGTTRREPRPLVLLLHGGSGNGRGILEHTGYAKLADAERFFVLAPDGWGGHWNDGRRGDFSPAATEGVDDVAFLVALLESVSDEYPVDPRRVYVAGVSNGAMMANRLGCDAADHLAAIASVIGQMPAGLEGRCHPSRPLSVLLVNGTDDPVVPYGGGTVRITDYGRDRGEVLSVSATLEFWAKADGCEPTPHDGDLTPSVGVASFSGCRDGVSVVGYAVRGSGHAWPGAGQYAPKAIVGEASDSIDVTVETWQFFEKAPLLGAP